MVVLSGDRPNSVNVRFRVSLYSLSSVGCQISFSGFLLLSCSVFNKLSMVSSWNGYLRLFILWYIRLLVIEGFYSIVNSVLCRRIICKVICALVVNFYQLGAKFYAHLGAITCFYYMYYTKGNCIKVLGAIMDLSR
ncbi:hypothetical protein C2G38_2145183 [Gigaspora rosea]|uniref:Uncharacterized protein n=1 Tax=Gigaspora rosea TaxID=44941 RepID=A0A397UPR8_9GLOM|nr:hypothetical protein C2G38_2145183 [Gigaspora rosea]